MSNLSIVCALPEEELARRESDLVRELFPAILDQRELPDGFAFQFPGESRWIMKLVEFVSFERECCPFLAFELHLEAHVGPVWLHLRGPDGTKNFLAQLLSPE